MAVIPGENRLFSLLVFGIRAALAGLLVWWSGAAGLEQTRPEGEGAGSASS